MVSENKVVEPIYSPLPAHWQLTTIGLLVDAGTAELQTGPFGTMLHASSYVEAGVPVVAVKNIGKNRLISIDLPRVDQVTFTRLSKYSLDEGDIVFGRKGAVERAALVTGSEAGWLQGSDCIRLRFRGKTVLPTFMSYVFSSPAYREWIARNAQGATMPSLNQEILRRAPIPLPPLSEQRAIAHILGTLDDKIELNRRMNATLEAIARAIFKSWFVDFDPVHAKARGEQPSGMDAETAALFPASFEESELGPIPAGWGAGTLGDIAGNPRRGIKPEDMEPNTLYIGLEHMPQRSITLDTWGSASDVASNKFTFRKGEFLFGKLRPYFHKVGIAPEDGVCSTDILVIVPAHEAWHGLTLFHISGKEFIDYTTAASTGTRMPRTNWDTMSKYPIVIPNREVAEAFCRVLRPMIGIIQNNIWQSRTLATFRDALLPRLISGEIRVVPEEVMS